MALSSVGIESADATFDAANVIASIYPVATTLVALGMLGGTLADSVKNLRNPDVDLAVIGTPVITPTPPDAICTAANCFDTGKLVAGDFTYAVVAKLVATAPAMMMGNFSASEGKGDGVAFIPASNQIKGYVGVAAQPVVATTGLTLVRHRLIVLRGSAGSATLSVYNDATTPVAVSNTLGVTNRNASANSVRVGASRDAAAFGAAGSVSEVAFWGLWGAFLTDAQVEGEIRPFLAAALDPSLGAAV